VGIKPKERVYLQVPGRVPRVSFVPGGRGGIVNQWAYVVQRDIGFPHHQSRVVNTAAGGDVAETSERTLGRHGRASSPLNGSRGGRSSYTSERGERREVRVNCTSQSACKECVEVTHCTPRRKRWLSVITRSPGLPRSSPAVGHPQAKIRE